jgi:arabinogalactan endo-1,4-beta-galactosidase
MIHLVSERIKFVRQLLLVGALLLSSLASQVKSQQATNAAQPTSARLGTIKPMPPYIVGADISSVQAAEDRGVAFSDDGASKDILQIFKDHGFNYIRLRVFVDPTQPTPRGPAYSMQGYCDLAHTIAMAKRIKAAGMGLLIDFHYSDSWADPGKQFTPSAWKNLSFADLVNKMHDWTKDAIQQMKEAGAEPDMVQIGNEITPGLMTDRGGSTRDWDQLAQLLKAGISGVEDVDGRIIIMLHIDKGGDNATTRKWVDAALSRGVQFDVLGESCYTRWQGTPADWKANFEQLVTQYPSLYFVCAEIADEVRSSNDIMRGLPDHKGLGTFIWEPTQDGNGQGLFTSAGRGRRGANTNPATPLPNLPRLGAVITEKMSVYDQLAKDYGLKTP